MNNNSNNSKLYQPPNNQNTHYHQPSSYYNPSHHSNHYNPTAVPPNPIPNKSRSQLPNQNSPQKKEGSSPHAYMQANLQMYHNNNYQQYQRRYNNYQYAQPNNHYAGNVHHYRQYHPNNMNSNIGTLPNMPHTSNIPNMPNVPHIPNMAYQNHYGLMPSYNQYNNYAQINETPTKPLHSAFPKTQNEDKRHSSNKSNYGQRPRNNNSRDQKNYKEPKRYNDYKSQSHRQHSKSRERFSNNKPQPQPQYPKQPSEVNKIQKSHHYNEQHEEQHDSPDIKSYSSGSAQSEEEEFYIKKKIIKKKDPVLDSKQEIRKWILARKRNYPKKNMPPQEMQQKNEKLQISILQKKIRKKILLINCDNKSIMKKMKDIDILRRFILYPRNNRKTYNPHSQYRNDNYRRQIERPVQEMKPIEDIKEFTEVKIAEKEMQVKEEEQILQVSDKKAQQAEAQSVDGQPQQLPIKQQKMIEQIVVKENPGFQKYRRQQLTVDVIIKHLQMKQEQDTKLLQNLMDYKSNSFNYRYQHNTLETNMLLQDIFNESSYILQAIRYIIKKNFFDQKQEA